MGQKEQIIVLRYRSLHQQTTYEQLWTRLWHETLRWATVTQPASDNSLYTALGCTSNADEMW